MIPKASQRGGGQDLATHLLNACDNEYLEVAEVRGAVASDLHGAFGEWEAVAANLTRCRNYLYSLSVNPDLGQGELTREQYLDYLDRAERRLGLEGQPRAVVFHIKDGREHCHAVWSRIDHRSGKAIHMAFDREKLMMVSREFARNHGLDLPEGYGRDGRDDRAGGKKKSLSLYEKVQERATGLSKEERMLMVTRAWRLSDTPRAFVRALEDMGYVLATGKRPYVLIDMYGGMNALPKLIDDRAVRTKDIRAFLERDFPPSSLPTVEQARALVAEHRKAREEFAKAQKGGTARQNLQQLQAARRAEVLAAQTALQERQRQERVQLGARHLAERRNMAKAFLDERAAIRGGRALARPTGLAAFLGRVTGVSLVRQKLHRHQDARRYRAYLQEKEQVTERQQAEKRSLSHRHMLQGFDMNRQVNALSKVEQRERKALDTKELRAQRMKQRDGQLHMPTLSLDLKPRGRGAVVHKAQRRFQDRSRFEYQSNVSESAWASKEALSQIEERREQELSLRTAHQDAMERVDPWLQPVDLAGDFARAAGGETGEGEGGEQGQSRPRLSRAEKRDERARRGRKRGDDFERER